MLKISCENDHDPYILRGSKNTVKMGLPDCPVCSNEMTLEDAEES
jgi:hypothetical protein